MDVRHEPARTDGARVPKALKRWRSSANFGCRHKRVFAMQSGIEYAFSRRMIDAIVTFPNEKIKIPQSPAYARSNTHMVEWRVLGKRTKRNTPRKHCTPFRWRKKNLEFIFIKIFVFLFFFSIVYRYRQVLRGGFDPPKPRVYTCLHRVRYNFMIRTDPTELVTFTCFRLYFTLIR